MGVDITIYLMCEGTSLESALQAEKVGPDYIEVPPRKDAAFDLPHICYVRTTQPTKPKWAPWLEDKFDFGHATPATQASGCVLSVESCGRVFALAFGQGWHAIDLTRVEHDFGLRAALNTVHPNQLRQLVSKTVEIRTREKTTYHHSGGAVGDFGMDLETEWLRSVVGPPHERVDFGQVSGTHAIRLRNYQKTLAEISDLCKYLLDAYSKEPPEAFAFIEHVRSVDKNDPLHARLEYAFAEKVGAVERTKVEVIVDAEVMRRMHSARLFVGVHECMLDDLTNDSVWDAVEQLVSEHDGVLRSQIKIDIKDANGERVMRRPLLDVVQAELELDGITYVRLERRWFGVTPEYVRQVDERVRALPNVTAKLSLPTWEKWVHAEESDFNRYVSDEKDWLLQDQEFICTADGSKFEPCDLLNESAFLIHVKEGKSSSCLNHLFGQISVAAELYRRHEPSRREIQARYASKWHTTPLSAQRPTFVAAIGRDVSADLLGRMLIAKINLLDHARRVRALDCDFAVAGFPVAQEPPSIRPSRRRRTSRASTGRRQHAPSNPELQAGGASPRS